LRSHSSASIVLGTVTAFSFRIVLQDFSEDDAVSSRPMEPQVTAGSLTTPGDSNHAGA
jgi:hypothetical protein